MGIRSWWTPSSIAKGFSLGYFVTLLKGGALALVTIGVSIVIPENLVYPFFAMLLTFAAGVYVGFALVDRLHIKEYKLQILVSILFIGMGLFGLWFTPLLIAAGWAVHGLWDLLHHLRQLRTETGKSYPLLCLGYDFIIAWYIYYYWITTSNL